MTALVVADSEKLVKSKKLDAALTPEDGYRAGAPPHTTLNAGISVIGTNNFITTIL